ncbi:MAG: holdfast anchor protein HfaD [Caulobacteraceae bacterium]|nr:holdfast anchor protein HfaD [Caulobacteraceae bacterium]
MRRPAKILLAGTILVMPLLPPLCAVATSQSTVDNSQYQSGDVFSTQTLNVVDVSDATTGTTTATGNAVSSAVEAGALDVRSAQTLTAAVNASTTVNVTTNAGAQTTLTTAATGNTSDSGSYAAGALTGTVTQTISDTGSVTAGTQFNADAAQTGAVSASAQAIGNSHGVTVQDTSATMTVNQTNNGVTQASGDAILQYTPGDGTFSATAVSNNVTGYGTGASSQTLTINQTASSASPTGQTIAEQDVHVGNGQAITGAATATGNNISVTNENGPLTVTDVQSSSGYIQSQAQVSAYEFGSVQATAYGVGNSALAGNYGQSLNLDNTQTNSGGGIDVLAKVGGNDGYDAYATSTAMGNAVTGYACSDCNGTISVRNTQSNSSGVGATTQVDIAASNRSVTGTATAVGNSATFYVSKPTH